MYKCVWQLSMDTYANTQFLNQWKIALFCKNVAFDLMHIFPKRGNEKKIAIYYFIFINQPKNGFYNKIQKKKSKCFQPF